MEQREINASEIKNLLGDDIAELINNFTDGKKPLQMNYMYSGRVENNNDSKQLGRCQIRVYGVHSDKIPTAHLPWVKPDFKFTGSTLGSFVVPPIDAIIQVYFDKGDIYSPRYTTKVVTNSLPNDIGEDYPDTMVFFETDEGESFKINRKTGRTIYRHSSGTMLTISQDGSVELTTDPAEVGDIDINIKGNAKICATKLTVGEPGFASLVTPAAPTEGGPFCALPQCLFTGAPHQGKVVESCRTLGGLEVN